jgi:hypothetical protein
MKYPKECPVFEVIETGHTWNQGAIVVGEGVGTLGAPYLAITAPDLSETSPAFRERYERDRAHYDLSRVQNGRWHAEIHEDQIRPLTRAACEMLALVKS